MKKIFVTTMIFSILLLLASCTSARHFATEEALENAEQNMNATEEVKTAEPTSTAAPALQPPLAATSTPAPTGTPSATPMIPPPTIAQTETAVPSQVDQMTIEEKVAQLFMLSCAEVTAGELLSSYNLGGVIFFKDDIQTTEQTTELTAKLNEQAETPLFIGIDEEGGIVSRLGNLDVKRFANAATVKDEQSAYERGEEIAKIISSLGFNLNFAPIADVNTNPNNPVIGDRAFSSDPEWAASLVAAFVKGSQENNVLASLKHFPGHGDTTTDSHLGLATADHDIERLRTVEFIPFESGIKADAAFVMIGHLSLPSITGSDEPAIFSKEIIDLLKNELNFDGLVITDALNMGAITEYYSAGETAVKAIQAGVDILLMPNDFDEAFNAVLAAIGSGEITEERINLSVEHILQTKQKYGIMP